MDAVTKAALPQHDPDACPTCAHARELAERERRAIERMAEWAGPHFGLAEEIRRELTFC